LGGLGKLMVNGVLFDNYPLGSHPRRSFGYLNGPSICYAYALMCNQLRLGRRVALKNLSLATRKHVREAMFWIALRRWSARWMRLGDTPSRLHYSLPSASQVIPCSQCRRRLRVRLGSRLTVRCTRCAHQFRFDGRPCYDSDVVHQR
jgi:hypothetical protein